MGMVFIIMNGNSGSTPFSPYEYLLFEVPDSRAMRLPLIQKEYLIAI
jgi:hypothetical protein